MSPTALFSFLFLFREMLKVYIASGCRWTWSQHPKRRRTRTRRKRTRNAPLMGKGRIPPRLYSHVQGSKPYTGNITTVHNLTGCDNHNTQNDLETIKGRRKKFTKERTVLSSLNHISRMISALRWAAMRTVLMFQ